MKLVGYSDKFSVEPGDDIQFMVSSEPDSFDATVIRLINGDDNPTGPGFKSEVVESELAGEYPGKYQKLRPGSYVRVPASAALDIAGSFTIQMWIRPTMPDKQEQTLISRVSEDGAGFALRLESGRLTLHVGPGLEPVVALEKPVELHTWYSVSAVYDGDSGQARVALDPLASTAGELADQASASVAATAAAGGGGDLTIGAELVSEDGETVAGNFYNGKVDSPRLVAAALEDSEIVALRNGDPSNTENLVAAWDFSADISSSMVRDRSSNELNGRTVNKPMRGATGWNWDTTETAWPHAPEQYGAIHFHDDDLDDAGWEPSLRWSVPDDMRSDVYAVHLQSGDDEDFIPFVVRPKRGRPTAKIALLMPFFSFLAYANEHELATGESMEQFGVPNEVANAWPVTPNDKYLVENKLNSLYDVHTDGSGVCYSSKLRPLANIRPKYNMTLLNMGQGSPHQFNADLHLVDWLHESGYEFDVITDEDLHLEGAALLEPYNVVLSGPHPEYWSLEMIRSTQQYMDNGGHFMYMGGNGVYWVTQYDGETGNGVEIRRRGPATRSWEPEPGEAHLSATGELGGSWRFRGLAPQSWLGVGWNSWSFDQGRPYERQPDSFDERAAWVFEGVGDDEKIGDFPALVNTYGAAGHEIDRVDYALGTPHRTLVLATATGFSSYFHQDLAEGLLAEPDGEDGAAADPNIRADMVLIEYPKGGAVFSTGSISWCSCLSYNNYDNNVSRITRNVVDRFSSDAT